MKMQLVILLIIGLCMSCSKDDDDSAANNTLEGKWELIETLNDPGDGSGVFQPVESDKTIEFFEDGTVISNGSLCFNGTDSNMESSGTYSVEDSIIVSDDCASTGFDISFEWNDNILIINYPCIEPCQAKYIKIN